MNTSRCDPLDGYYDDGSSFVAQACDGSCLTCFNNSFLNCLSCDATRVLDSNECKLCSVVLSSECMMCILVNGSFVCTNCSAGTLVNGNCLTSS